MNLTPVESITLLISLISIVGNIIQWRLRKTMRKNLKHLLQATYNQFRQITNFVDAFRLIESDNKTSIYDVAIRRGNEVAGVSSSARSHITSFMREHLDCVPRNEHWDKPVASPLERVKKENEV